jgi:large conductance mechanosensitive channel
MRSFLDEFKKFIMRGNVIDLAVGIVIGVAFTAIVNSLVKDIFMPIIGLITGGFDISTQTATLHGDAKLGWGAFLQTLINFVLIGFCLFLVVKGMNRMKERGWIEAPPPPEPTSAEKLLAEIRDLLKKQAGEKPAEGVPGSEKPTGGPT